MTHLIELYSLHQRALLRAASTEQDALRKEHEAHADDLASEIADIQQDIGANAVELLPASTI